MNAIHDPASVPGFRAAGAMGGIKVSGKPDLALIVCEGPCVAAATTTRNQAAAPSVWRTRRLLAEATHRGVVINSGNANCCNGAAGERDDAAMAAHAAAALGCAEAEIFTCSTGVIGVPLPMAAVRRGIDAAVQGLAAPAFSVAETILTTDLVAKTARRDAAGYRLIGIAKGSGMIHPNMATMLAVVCTDAAIARDRLQALTREAVARSFNCISVDNDESTNDTCLVLASGQGAAVTDETAFLAELTALMQDLARQIVGDGEGAGHLVEIRISGATNEIQADHIARAIADSMLVKTAIAGGDPNWGRIVCAAGYSGVDFALAALTLRLNGIVLFSQGQGHDDERRPFQHADGRPCTRAELAATMAAPEQLIELDLGQGATSWTRWTCDLTHGYIRINADYTT